MKNNNVKYPAQNGDADHDQPDIGIILEQQAKEAPEPLRSFIRQLQRPRTLPLLHAADDLELYGVLD